MAKRTTTTRKFRALTLTVDIEQVAFVDTIDVDMEISGSMTGLQTYHVMSHVLAAMGDWAEQVIDQTTVNSQGGRVE